MDTLTPKRPVVQTRHNDDLAVDVRQAPDDGENTQRSEFDDLVLRVFYDFHHVHREDSDPGNWFLAIDNSGNEALLTDRCRDALSALRSGGYLAIVSELPPGRRLKRLVHWAGMRRRVACAERALRTAGADRLRQYGVYPSLQSPTIVYELGSPAARYAERNLLMGASGTASRFLCGALSRWAGFDISLGATVVIGQRP